MLNAIDHGLADDRPGTIEICWQLIGAGAGRTLAIELSDDGRGLDLTALVEKAIAAGRVTREQAASLNPSEQARLALMPGISTRDSSTQLSGMGTGLDSVRAEIEGMGGSLAIVPRKGGGTVARVVLPAPGELQSSIL